MEKYNASKSLLEVPDAGVAQPIASAHAAAPQYLEATAHAVAASSGPDLAHALPVGYVDGQTVPVRHNGR